MTELWLNIEHDDGEPERVRVDREEFVIGRHSASDLVIPLGSISRQHAKISRFGDVFVISDCDSTLGTKLNGQDLSEPVGLKDGDILKLGDATEIGVEFVSDEDASPSEDPAEQKPAEGPAVAAAPATGSSIPTSFFYIVPIFGLVILLCLGGGAFLLFTGNDGPPRSGKDNDEVAASRDDDGRRRKPSSKPGKESPEPEASAATQSPPSDLLTDDAVGQDTSPPPKPSGEIDKLRTYSAAFLSRIVAKDPDAFLLDRQIQQVTPVVNSLKSSAAVAANIGQAKRDSAKIAAIAAENGLKPEFLAAAAIAKLGTGRGDVVTTARTMAGTLQKLQAVIGVESADEATVVIAAYYQGAGGSFQKMQSTLEGLTKGNDQGLSARQIRTVWFLNEKGKLKPEEYDLALRFIAIGTIMQKPDEFGVK